MTLTIKVNKQALCPKTITFQQYTEGIGKSVPIIKSLL